MKTLMTLVISVMCISVCIGQTDSARQSSNYMKQKQAAKPETHAQKESGTQSQTGTIQGKSGIQGQHNQKPVSGTKAQNESGVQGETSSLSGRSGTQGQTTQGETSDSLNEQAAQTRPTETPNMRDTQYRTDDVTQVSTDMLPESLRETLRNDEYKGWESGTISHDKIKNEYLLEMVRENKRLNYRFDQHGKRVSDNNK
jgi:hypothetical protein